MHRFQVKTSLENIVAIIDAVKELPRICKIHTFPPLGRIT